MAAKDKYFPADEFVMVNDRSRRTYPIKIDIPKCPDITTIDGYGLNPENQVFQYEKYPAKLKKLEADCNGVIDEIFKKLEKNQKTYKSEIKWIKKQWLRRLTGYWFFCNGKPTYIDGWHYFYLNYYKLDIGKPKYYDRDRRWFLFARYCYTDTKAVYSWHCLEKDGTKKYFSNQKEAKEYSVKNNLVVIQRDEIVEMGRRVCYGFNSLKGRRVGDSYKGLAIGMELITRSIEGVCGIQSMDEDTGRKLFLRQAAAWKKLPFFFQPMYSCGTNPQEKITFYAPSERGGSNVVGFNIGLESVIDFASTVNRSYYDGQKLLFYLSDEDGKIARNEDINIRWDIPKQCMVQGSNINGFSIHPSTAGEMNKGGENFYQLFENSRYEVRNDNGETISGLYTWFAPADDAHEGFIDKFGMSIMDTPTKEQAAFIGKKIGAKEFIMNKRKVLIQDGSDKALQKLRMEQRLYPLEYEDCFMTDDGDIGMPYEIINKRINELIFERDLVVRGNFMREIPNDLTSRVVFVENEQIGRWFVSKVLTPMETNLKYLREGHWYPSKPTRFIASADPFRLSNVGNKKYSDGGGAVFWNRDMTIDPETKDIMEWESNRFVCTYSYRSKFTEDYAEDMLMMCEYYGCMCFPEINLPLIVEYFRQRGYFGFLKFGKDKTTGKRKLTPGYSSTGNTKPELFNSLRDYIQLHGHRERHSEILMECKSIKGLDDMTNHDLFTACSGCLLSNENSYENAVEQAIKTYNIKQAFPVYTY
jgi:hypothetical protein